MWTNINYITDPLNLPMLDLWTLHQFPPPRVRLVDYADSSDEDDEAMNMNEGGLSEQGGLCDQCGVVVVDLQAHEGKCNITLFPQNPSLKRKRDKKPSNLA